MSYKRRWVRKVAAYVKSGMAESTHEWECHMRKYGPNIPSFRTCYFHTFENIFALPTSSPRLVVRRYGGTDVWIEVQKCPVL
ncbi:hypothetical protein E2C01_069693 [Portunus trituberculatus]|uniref:Uncharacterized protein n=1 Tax=Portunus trituberculatus TaxID=210409 RepID=A0A5B7I1H5_PORTR|nr:hypothetical protein [Portunus trituberculatus]